MLKKCKYLIIATIGAICLSLCGPYFWDIYHYLPFPKKEIHVFFETHATAPAFSQIIEFSKLPKETKKIIGWSRFQNRGKLFDLKEYNTIEIPMQNGQNNLTNFMLTVINELFKDPSKSVVFHTSFDKVATSLKPFLNVIPKQRIKAIHLYEDGYGDVLKWNDAISNETALFMSTVKEETAELLEPKNEDVWLIRHVFGLREFYPVTYHFLKASQFKKIKRLEKIFTNFNDLTLSETNFYTLAKTLTPEQKQIIFQLTNFDYEKYKNLMQNKKSIMFVTGFHFGLKAYMDAEIKVLSLLKENKLENFKLENPQDYVWFFKPHPAYDQIYKQEIIKNNFPDIIEIPPEVPFEVFILAGLKPTFTAGFSSSLFFSLKSEDILFYAKRPKYPTSPLAMLDDHYLAALLTDGQVKSEQVILYENYFEKTSSTPTEQ